MRIAGDEFVGGRVLIWGRVVFVELCSVLRMVSISAVDWRFPTVVTPAGLAVGLADTTAAESRKRDAKRRANMLNKRWNSESLFGWFD